MILSEDELRKMERDSRGLNYVSIETKKLKELIRCYRDHHPEIVEEEIPTETNSSPVDYLGIARKRPTDD